MVCGQLPFEDDDLRALFHKITRAVSSTPILFVLPARIDLLSLGLSDS